MSEIREKKNFKGFFIGVSLIISALIFSTAYQNSKKPIRSLSITGLAKKDFESDTVKWSISFQEMATIVNKKEGFLKVKKEINKMKSLLVSAGITNDKIYVQPGSFYQNYDKNGIPKSITISQGLYVVATNIAGINNLALNPGNLAKKGIYIQNSKISYFSSKIDQLKKDLISKAVQNAKDRAKKMVSQTDVKIDKLISLSSGIFQITEPYSTSYASYGVYNTASKNKEIKVTVHAKFELK